MTFVSQTFGVHAVVLTAIFAASQSGCSQAPDSAATTAVPSDAPSAADGTSPVFTPLSFAKKTLADSFAARAELGDIRSVETLRNEGLGHAFAVAGSKQSATMTLLSITPGGDPSGTLFLEDGRQIPLFMPFLEESYKSDLGL